MSGEEFGFKIFEDENGNLIAGNTVGGANNSTYLDQSSLPEGSRGTEVGGAHSHPSGAGASYGDFAAWYTMTRTDEEGRKWMKMENLSVVVAQGGNCCEINGKKDKSHWTFNVEVWV